MASMRLCSAPTAAVTVREHIAVRTAARSTAFFHVIFFLMGTADKLTSVSSTFLYTVSGTIIFSCSARCNNSCSNRSVFFFITVSTSLLNNPSPPSVLPPASSFIPLSVSHEAALYPWKALTSLCLPGYVILSRSQGS